MVSPFRARGSSDEQCANPQSMRSTAGPGDDGPDSSSRSVLKRLELRFTGKQLLAPPARESGTLKQRLRVNR